MAKGGLTNGASALPWDCQAWSTSLMSALMIWLTRLDFLMKRCITVSKVSFELSFAFWVLLLHSILLQFLNQSIACAAPSYSMQSTPSNFIALHAQTQLVSYPIPNPRFGSAFQTDQMHCTFTQYTLRATVSASSKGSRT